MGRIVFAYVDDILMKSTTLANHPHVLKETLETLLTNGMSLNADKCHFRVLIEKFLGFYVGKGDIRLNPEKIKAIITTILPCTIREVQKLNGKINALSHFISKNAEKCKPFFQLLKFKAKER